jgi:hypothetical protein
MELATLRSCAATNQAIRLPSWGIPDGFFNTIPNTAIGMRRYSVTRLADLGLAAATAEVDVALRQASVFGPLRAALPEATV